MAIEWAGLGPELLLALDRTRAEPLRVQLERELREAIRSGRLAAGERLPSSRALAAELGISRGLVLDCYSQLQAEGFLTSHTGSATRVAAGALAPAAGPEASAHAPVPAPTGPVPEARLAVDFCPGVPDLTSFPRADWARAMRDSCRTATAGELGYGDPRGTDALRHVLAGYLRRVRGTVADADQIVICAGFGQGINLVLRSLAGDGARRVAIEDPGDDDYLEICRRLGLEAVPVAIDERGIDVEALADAGVRAVILTPTHQFPTGTALAPERRQALVAWAAERDAVIIEDDYDAEFRYDRDPVGALQGLAPDRVALIGTVSKSLAPALRIGWIVCPGPLVDSVIEDKRLSDRGSDPRPAGARPSDRIRAVRPAPAPDARRLLRAARCAGPEGRRAGPARRARRTRGGLPRGRATAPRGRRAGDRRAGQDPFDRAVRHELVPPDRGRRAPAAGARVREPERGGDRARDRRDQRSALTGRRAKAAHYFGIELALISEPLCP